MTSQGMPTEFFEAAYRGENDGGRPEGQQDRDATAPVWDLGEPQPVLVALEKDGKVHGDVLDLGCGTGDFSLHLARLGYTVTGVDVAPTAIDRARQKAERNGLTATFEVADARRLDGHVDAYDTVVDCGLLHNLSAADAPAYAAALQRATRPGAHVHVIGFSDELPGDWGPRRLTEADFRATFAAGWELESLKRIEIVGYTGDNGAKPMTLQAWLVTARRL
ncbi:class I SAM-dependent methyltransferase [Streptomyces sp. NPDC050636]|uniref:class I SAM-dependent methyltransferase n=1 Tax=Streptomyces sp. NPDC050636 TaxID=3154510 RepID=UPI0034347E5D